MGGKNVGYGCLRYLIDNGKNIVGVFINKKGEFIQNRWFNSTAELALRNNIPLFMPDKVNSPETIKLVRKINPEMIVIVYYDQILRKEIIEIPRCGCINLHLALAEDYRGCYPTTWTIINGETRTGVTLHYIDENVDSGDIIAQAEIKIEESDTGKTLYNKCTEKGIELFSEVFPKLEKGKVNARKQIHNKVKYFNRIFPSKKIDFTKSGKEIYNFVRALIFEPFDPPYFYIGETKMIVIPEEKLRKLMK